mgnify:CR=1 FL=1
MESPIEKYIKEHSSIPNKALDWVEKQTNIKTNYPRMLSGRITGELLTLIAKMIHAHHILEIGCFTGYSTICLAEGIMGEGHVDSLEINDELEKLILEGWKKAGISNKARLHIGDALESIKKFTCEKLIFDMVYIDANKREYLTYYKATIPLLKSGGIIIADDTMLGGKVYDTPLTSDKQTRGLIEFNDYIINDPTVESVMLPLRDGLSIIRKK